jgi:hypothetical protein
MRIEDFGERARLPASRNTVLPLNLCQRLPGIRSIGGTNAIRGRR